MYVQRSEGGGAFEALDMLNGQLLCGYDNVYACKVFKFFKLQHDLLIYKCQFLCFNGLLVLIAAWIRTSYCYVVNWSGLPKKEEDNSSYKRQTKFHIVIGSE